MKTSVRIYCENNLYFCINVLFHHIYVKSDCIENIFDFFAIIFKAQSEQKISVN